jgi:hypothetical protein
MDIKATLTRKIGPLPAIGWAGIVGAIFVGFKYYESSKSNKATDAAVADAVTTLPDAVGDIGSSGDFSNGYGNATGNGAGLGSSTTNSYVDAAPDDNQTWGKRAINYLLSLGVNPTDAATAIASYINQTGQALNSVQSAALQSALQHYGAPPDGLITPPPTTPPPIAGQTPAIPTPTPKPTNVAPTLSRIINVGTPGSAGWTAFRQYADGTVDWLSNGDEYQRLISSGVATTQYGNNLGTFIDSHKNRGGAPSTATGDLATRWDSHTVAA